MRFIGSIDPLKRSDNKLDENARQGRLVSVLSHAFFISSGAKSTRKIKASSMKLKMNMHVWDGGQSDQGCRTLFAEPKGGK